MSRRSASCEQGPRRPPELDAISDRHNWHLRPCDLCTKYVTMTCVVCFIDRTPGRIEKLGEDSYRFTYTDADGADHTIDAGLVMMATGRAARSHGLGLEVGCSQPP